MTYHHNEQEGPGRQGAPRLEKLPRHLGQRLGGSPGWAAGKARAPANLHVGTSVLQDISVDISVRDADVTRLVHVTLPKVTPVSVL